MNCLAKTGKEDCEPVAALSSFPVTYIMTQVDCELTAGSKSITTIYKKSIENYGPSDAGKVWTYWPNGDQYQRKTVIGKKENDERSHRLKQRERETWEENSSRHVNININAI
jgi:hypothetical protein